MELVDDSNRNKAEEIYKKSTWSLKENELNRKYKLLKETIPQKDDDNAFFKITDTNTSKKWEKPPSVVEFSEEELKTPLISINYDDSKMNSIKRNVIANLVKIATEDDEQEGNKETREEQFNSPPSLTLNAKEKELCDRGDKLMREALFEEALDKYNEILEIRKDSVPDDRLVAQVMTKIGHVYYELGNYDEALKCHSQALDMRRKSFTNDHPDIAESLNNVGKIMADQGKYKEALEHHNTALSIYRKTVPKNHPSMAETLHNIGRVYDCQLSYESSLSYYTDSLRMKKQTLPENHPDIATTLKNIGIVYSNKKRFNEALDFYDQSLEIYSKTLASNHPHIAATYNCIGFVYNNQAKYEDALENFNKSLEMYKQTLPPNHPHIGTTLHNVGLAYHKQAKFEEALRFYYQSLEVKQKTLPKDHPKVLKTSNNVSLCPLAIRKKVEKEFKSKQNESQANSQNENPQEPLLKEEEEKDLRTNKASSDFNRSTKLKLYERSNSVNEPPIIKEIVNDRYIVQRVLEKGDFGHVVLVVDETERNEKEMKLFDFDLNKDNQKLYLLPELSEVAEKELQLIQAIDQRNLVRYFGCFQKKIAYNNYFCVITEHLKKQSLRDRIDEASKTGIKFDPETTILGWALQAVSGLKYLHHNGIIHRDINPSNMFICENNEIKLGNFGFVKLIKGTKASKYAISSPYMSPEQFRCYFEPLNYTSATDIWALGCVIFELLFLELAFPLGQRGDLKIPNLGDSIFTQVLLKMLDKDPSDRISAKDLLTKLSAFLAASNSAKNLKMSENEE